MNNTNNLYSIEAIDKLKSLIDDIKVCLFCTDLKAEYGLNCRPMTAIKVCSKGNTWFFSEKDSVKNSDIEKDNKVQLFFSSPAKSSFLIVSGEATIILDRKEIAELWNPVAKIWFKKGKDDPNISIIKVTPSNAYYWDTDGNQMANFIKLVASVATGTNLVTGKEGAIKI